MIKLYANKICLSMGLIPILAILLCTSFVGAAAKVSLVNGVVVFNDGYDVNRSTFVNVVDVPTNFELSIASSGIKFKSASDFRLARDNKEYLEDKIEDLAPSKARKNDKTIKHVEKENNKR